MIENKSVIVNTLRNCECISLPEENFQEIETEKEDTTEQPHKFKDDILDEFSEFKTKFLYEVKSFKDNILNTTPKSTRNQENIITEEIKTIASNNKTEYTGVRESEKISKTTNENSEQYISPTN